MAELKQSKRLILAATAITLVAGGTAMADEAVYRELFPGTGWSSLSTAGWNAHVTPQAFSAVLSGKSHIMPTNNPTGALPAVNSTAAPTSEAKGYVFDDWGGSFWRNMSLYWTQEYSIDRTQWDLTRVTWQQATSSADETRVALRVGGQWFVSEQTFINQSSWMMWDLQYAPTKTLDLTTATWLSLTFDIGVAMGVGAPTALPATGNIDGVGLWFDYNDGSEAFDTFTVWGNAKVTRTPGDADNDGDVDLDDFALWQGGFTGTGGAGATADTGDFDTDGDADLDDFAVWQGNFTGSLAASPVAVPEPAAISLLALAGLMGLRRRRA